jgi:S-adenosylmethionine:tRNA ribosyltransferase-isomerase
MIAATAPVHRSPRAKVMVVDASGQIRHLSRAVLIDLIRPGDLVVANDAATIPASLAGAHLPSHRRIEVRLAGVPSLDPDHREFSAVVFGEGDFHARTEDRPQPPSLAAGDQLQMGPLSAKILRLLDHPRLVLLEFAHSRDELWAGLAHHGRPIQYSHVPAPLALRDVWTPIAGPPVACEPPSAGFALSWQLITEMRAAGAQFKTITHAAGLSSTGDAELDKRLPFDELYRVPQATADAINQVKSSGRRIIAVGTTVVRALEHAVHEGKIAAGENLATERIGVSTRLQIVDALLSGTHEPGTSHYELLRAFLTDPELERLTNELNMGEYHTHEFGDSVLVSRTLNKRAEAKTGCYIPILNKPPLVDLNHQAAGPD